MKERILEKLTSRKFIAALITAIAGICTMIFGDNETIGALMTIVSTVVYCIMEGVIDAKSVKTITEATVDVAEKLGADKSTIDKIEQVGEVGEIIADIKKTE